MKWDEMRWNHTNGSSAVLVENLVAWNVNTLVSVLRFDAVSNE